MLLHHSTVTSCCRPVRLILIMSTTKNYPTYTGLLESTANYFIDNSFHYIPVFFSLSLTEILYWILYEMLFKNS